MELRVYKPRPGHKRDNLIEDKVYQCHWNESVVFSSDGIYYKLEDERGKWVEIHESHLIPLKKVREEKLTSIGI